MAQRTNSGDGDTYNAARVCKTCRHWKCVTPEKGACTQARPAIRTIGEALHYCYPIVDAAGSCKHWALDITPRLALPSGATAERGIVARYL